MKVRLGAQKAITATTHKRARLVYSMLRCGILYVDKGHDWYEQQYRSRVAANLHRRAKSMGYHLTLHSEADEAQVPKWEKHKADLVEEVEPIENELNQVKEQLKQTSKHISWADMPERDKFERLAPSRKQLMNIVTMITYRTETALAAIVREDLARPDDAHALVRDLCCSKAGMLPDLT